MSLIALSLFGLIEATLSLGSMAITGTHNTVSTVGMWPVRMESQC